MIRRMAALFDTLAAGDALEAAGMDRRTARACAAQIHAAVSTGEAVTRPEPETALAALETELVDRLAKMERILVDRISETERVLGDRLAEMERRLAALLWRLFGGGVALAGLVVAVLKLLP